MTVGPFYSLWQFDDRVVALWLPQAREAVSVLQAHAGFVAARVGRSVDEPGVCFVHTTWRDVGSYRRALSSGESKMRVWPWLADMRNTASAFESLLEADADGITSYATSLDEA